jgi:cyclophilin family peptidyl-prolyl cis-trans isomerase/HEAT repeat protein
MLIFIGLALLFTTCQRTDRHLLQEIKNYELRREAAPEKFITWLNSDDPNIRAQAVESLGRIQDTATVSWVANCLIDKNDTVRYKATFAIGQFFSEKAEEMIKTAIAIEKIPSYRIRLVEAFGKCATNKNALLLLDFIESGQPHYQKVGAISTGIISYRGYPLHNITPSLGILLDASDEPEITWSCTYGIYRTGTPAEFPNLVRALSKNDPYTRYFSLKAQNMIISYLKSPQARQFENTPTMKSIIKIMNSPEYSQFLSEALADSSWFVRTASLELLEKMTPGIKEPEILAMIDDPSPHIREGVLSVAGSYATSDARKFLKNVASTSQNWRESGLALEELSRLDPSYTIKKVKNRIDSLSWPQNYYLIQSLGRINQRTSTELLQKLANTENFAQLSSVLEILVNRPGISREFYIDMLRTNDPAITTIVASKFGILRDSKAVPALISSYQNFEAPEDIEPMISIIAALDSIGNTAALSFLREQINTPYLPLRTAALKALKKISGHDFTADSTQQLAVFRTNFNPIKEKKPYIVRFETTKGDFELTLYPEKAPLTVSNFLELVETGFYDGIYFHRVVPGFVIQGGDPRGDGWGGPGYSIPCEYNDIFYERGVLGMAHAGKDTGGSQFFITHTPQPHLNGKHTAFGKVLSGMAVVDQIEMFDQIIKAQIVK